MRWFVEAVQSPASGWASSSRIISLVAGLTLSFSTALLTIGSFWHVEMLPTLMAFAPSLAGLAGANYVTNRLTQAKKSDEQRS